MTCDAILGYLAEHPNASDTLEGIAAWWIQQDRIRLGVERVARALEWLRERGLVEERQEGGLRRYRLGPKFRRHTGEVDRRE